MKKKEVVFDWMRSLAWAAAIAVFIRAFFIGNFQIPSSSMVPTLRIGDRLLANRFVYAFRDPAPGEVVIFRFPLDPKRDFVKRLIAGPHDRVLIANGTIYVNDEKVTNPLIACRFYSSPPDALYAVAQPAEVPPHSYFVLGDNTLNSQDSRYWGFVPRKNFVGKAVFIYWPPWRMTFIR